MERGAAVLLEGALRDEEGEEFAFGDVDGGKRVDGVGVAVGLNLGIELDGEFEAVAHESEVADHGFAGDFEGADEVRAVDEGAAAELVVDAHHALEGRAGELGAGGGHLARKRGRLACKIHTRIKTRHESQRAQSPDTEFTEQGCVFGAVNSGAEHWARSDKKVFTKSAIDAGEAVGRGGGRRRE